MNLVHLIDRCCYSVASLPFLGFGPGVIGFLPFGEVFVASDWRLLCDCLIDFSGQARLAHSDKLEVTNVGLLGPRLKGINSWSALGRGHLSVACWDLYWKIGTDEWQSWWQASRGQGDQIASPRPL